MATIIEMVTHTRLDCVIGSACGMRRGVAEAIWHARHRSAFGRRLVEQPAMVNVLADLAVESEAATATALRLARAYDEEDNSLRRFATAVLKYWICKRATPHAAEALGVPRRQRLRRGVADAAAAARRAAERDLGGLGQRDVARRAARAGPRAGGAAGVPGRVRARPRAAMRGSMRTWTRWPRRPTSGVRGAASRTSRWRSRRRCWCGTRRRPSPTRSVRGGLVRRGGGCSGRLPVRRGRCGDRGAGPGRLNCGWVGRRDDGWRGSVCRSYAHTTEPRRSRAAADPASLPSRS